MDASLVFVSALGSSATDDLTGQKIAVIDASVIPFVENAGGVPILTFAPEIEAALLTGIIDGAMVPPEVANALDLENFSDGVISAVSSGIAGINAISVDDWNTGPWGVVVPLDIGVSTAISQLDGGLVLVETGGALESGVNTAFGTASASYDPVPAETFAEAVQQFLAGAADALVVPLSAIDQDALDPAFVLLEEGIGAGGDVIDVLEPVITGGDADDELVGSGADDIIRGLDGDDVLNGRAGSDELRGGSGNDILEGGSGGDRLFGGGGTDTVVFTSAPGGVALNLTRGDGTSGHANGDTYVSIENIVGSNFADVLIGSAGDNLIVGGRGADELRGSAGDDVLEGGGGGDIINGGSGIDTASFVTAGAGVTLNLTQGVGTGGNANGDRYLRIENILGSQFDDVLIGSAQDNAISGGIGADELRGSAGNDVLEGGSGADFINGGSGVDTASYVTSGSGVAVNLRQGVGTFGDAEGDTFFRVENVLGSGHEDFMVGSSDDNQLSGGRGDDRLLGAGGDDTLVGGRGDDTMTGGSGSDVFVFRANAGADVIDDFSRARDLIQFNIGGLSFDDLDVATVDGSAVIDYGSGTITLDGVSANLVTDALFDFG